MTKYTQDQIKQMKVELIFLQDQIPLSKNLKYASLKYIIEFSSDEMIVSLYNTYARGYSNDIKIKN